MDAKKIIEVLEANGIKAEVVEIVKGKGLQLGDGNIKPVVYFESFNTEQELISKVVADYSKMVASGEQFGNIGEKVMDYEWVRERLQIIVRPSNFESGDLIDMPLYDLKMLAQININNEAFIKIEKGMLKTWDRTALQVMADAIDNSNGQYLIAPMGDVVAEMARENGIEFDEDIAGEHPMYVITNSMKMNGAGALYYVGLFADLADKLDDDLYIIPSSIHELIVVPYSLGDKEDLNMMVEEVNESEVPSYERLGNHVYKYNRKAGMITW